MRAMVYRACGGPEKLELADLSEPAPGRGELLVRVIASSVNPVDWKLAAGPMRFLRPFSFPIVPGYDIAGEVAATGAGASGFRVGDRVHARIRAMTGGGSAELALAGVDVTAPIPTGMDPGEAAGLPLAGMTALQGLRDLAALPLTGARERVLVVGASGGVGHLAVQIARAAGATVVGVCSAANALLVRSLGAEDVIDYAAPDPYRGRGPFDVVLDCVGGPVAPWIELLGPRGRFASCLPRPYVFLRSALNPMCEKSVRPVMLKPRAEDLRTLGALVDAGKLRVVIDSRFPLAELAKAWERSKSGRATGKIVIDV